MIKAFLKSVNLDMNIQPVHVLGCYEVQEYVQPKHLIGEMHLGFYADGDANMKSLFQTGGNAEFFVLTREEYLEWKVNKEIMTE